MVWVNNSFSTGTVSLASADPAVEPAVDFNMCSDERDLARIIRATRMLVRMHDHAAVAGGGSTFFLQLDSDRVVKVGTFNKANWLKTLVAATLMDLGGPVRRAFIDNVIREGPTIQDLFGGRRSYRRLDKDHRHRSLILYLPYGRH